MEKNTSDTLDPVKIDGIEPTKNYLAMESLSFMTLKDGEPVELKIERGKVYSADCFPSEQIISILIPDYLTEIWKWRNF